MFPGFVETRITETMRETEAGTRERVERWMRKSGVTANDVARAVYEAVQDRTFLVLTHRETRWAWRLKRWLPGRYFRMLTRRAG